MTKGSSNYGQISRKVGTAVRNTLQLSSDLHQNTRFCVLLFYYHKLLFVFITAKFLLSLTKLSQIKRARPSTASITQPNSAEVRNLLFIAIRCPSIYRLDYLYFELGRSGN